MDYGYQIECVVEEYRRGVLRLQSEYDEMKRSLSADDGAALLEAIERVEAEREAQARLEADERKRLETEAREQREAIARSIAARKSKDVVTPIDEDDDPEGEYYRRKSWLI